MRDKVSVIVPIHNSQKYVKRCIESILKQTYAELELILVDDGSVDHSREWCLHYEKIDKRVVALCQQNQGASSARNIGLKYATGKYVLFVDSDDWIEENLLETVIMKSIEYQADAVVFGWKCEGNDTTCYRAAEKDIILSGREIIDKIIDDNYAYGGGYTFNKFWNRNALEKVQMHFDETLYAYEDKVFAIRNYLYINRIAIITDILYHYLIRDGSLSHPSNKDQYWQAKENVLLAHKKIAEICGVDRQLERKAHTKYYAIAMQLMASAVKYNNKRYLETSYLAIRGHYKVILQYDRWTILHKMKYALIAIGVKFYYYITNWGLGHECTKKRG